jgi:hypothetical protein
MVPQLVQTGVVQTFLLIPVPNLDKIHVNFLNFVSLY